MRELLREIKFSHILSAILCILFGVCLIVWPGLSTTAVCYAMGAMLLIGGISRIVSYFRNTGENYFFQADMVFGLIFSAVGIWMLFAPQAVLAIIPIIFGLMLMMHGFMDLQYAVNLKQMDYPRWWLAFLFAIVTVILGVVVLFNHYATLSTFAILIGIFLVVDGVTDIWIIARISAAAKKLKQELGQDYVYTERIDRDK